jgi:hypothetical protein
MILKVLSVYVFPIILFGGVVLSCKAPSIVPIATLQEEQTQADTLTTVALNSSTDRRIMETSGLIEISNHLWTHNDSGGGKVLYQLDDFGEISKEVTLDVPANIDWESLAADDTHFYVADIGNNLGKRENLRIFKGLKVDLLTKEFVSTETITFKYEDQETSYNGYNHNFDGEALISFQNHLYIFSKNWLDRKCKVYKLPKSAGDHVAKKIDEFDTMGLITGADIRKDQNEIALIGYRNNFVTREFFSFIIILTDWQNDSFFSGNVQHSPLTIERQTEAISYRESGEIWISSENNGPGDSSLFRIEFN